MIAQFAFYLKSRRVTDGVLKAHLSRAKKVLATRNPWTYEEAQSWIYNQAENNEWSESHINKWIQTFNHLDRCYEWNWTKHLKRIKENNRPPEMLSLEQSLEFYNLDTSPKWNLLIKLQMTTGARPSEILRLKRQDVDVDRQVITLVKTKTNIGRILIIQDFLIDEVKKYIVDNKIERNQLMFYYHDRYQVMSENAVIKEYKKRLKILGIDKGVRPYSMRHAFLTRMAGEINMSLLMEMAGHKNPKTSLKYIHNNEYVLKKAAQKDFLFDEMRDESVRMRKIIAEVNALSEKPNIDPVAIAQAVVYLRKAVRGT